jgi:hypothetical protein
MATIRRGIGRIGRCLSSPHPSPEPMQHPLHGQGREIPITGGDLLRLSKIRLRLALRKESVDPRQFERGGGRNDSRLAAFAGGQVPRLPAW